MADKKNALAELAECLSNDAEYLYGNNDKASEDVSKAQRIVAELSKVEDVNDVYRLKLVRRPNQDQALSAIVKCRAIAEEGAEDEK